MNSKLKTQNLKLILFAAVAALAFITAPPKVHAQADTKWILGQGTTTNNVATASTNTYALDIAAPKSGQICLSFGLKAQVSSNSVAAFTFKPVDGFGNVSTISAQAVTINVAENGTSQVYYITNQTWNAVPIWRLTSIGNTNAAGCFFTNITLRVITKNGI